MESSLPGFIPSKGQKVFFGRSHGEQTLGEVVKVNRARAKVKQLEARGTLKDHAVGTIWTVPFSLLTPAPSDSQPVMAPAKDADPRVEALGFPNTPVRTPKRSEAEIMRDILSVYSGLSPENLTCDGELPASQVRKRASALRAKLRVLFAEIGRPVSEDEAYRAAPSRF